MQTMLPQSENSLDPRDDFVKRLPKVDLHRHFSGSIRIKTINELATRYDLGKEMMSEHAMRSLLVIRRPRPFHSFMRLWSSINTLTNHIAQHDPGQFVRILSEVCEDARTVENVRYLEVRMPPFGLSIHHEINPELFREILSRIASSIPGIEERWDIKVKIILSLTRHFLGPLLPDERDRFYNALLDESSGFLYRPVSGFDLAGEDEDSFPPRIFSDFFSSARRLGFHATVHAAETGSAENAREAVETLHAERLGHALHATENPDVLRCLRERGTTVEVCLTSNYLVGDVPRIERHPIRALMAAGVSVTLNTDDPVVFDTDLNREYALASRTLGISVGELRAFNVSAIKGSFMTAREIVDTLPQLCSEWDQVVDRHDSGLGG